MELTKLGNHARRRRKRILKVTALVLTCVCVVIVVGRAFGRALFRDALIEAVEKGQENRVRRLLLMGADPDSDNAERPDIPWYRLIFNPSAAGKAPIGGVWKTALALALQQPNGRITIDLLNAGANPNAPSSDGRTPITMLWEEYGFQKGACSDAAKSTPCPTVSPAALLRSLLAHGVDINSLTDQRHNALMQNLLSISDQECTDLLLRSKIDILAKDDDGRSVFHYACRYGDAKLVNILITKGCDVNSRDENGVTPLMAAAEKGDLDIVKTLVSHGANLDTRDSNSITALECTVEHIGAIPVCRYLLLCGANPFLRTEGETPLDYIIRLNGSDGVFYSETIGLLESAMALHLLESELNIPLFR